MDAFFFSMKRAHLGWERLGRELLKDFELTPARFDLLNTIADSEDEDAEPITQAEIWKRLGVVRSAVCEMVKALVELGLISRRRVPEERTYFVELTALGRRVRSAAYDGTVNNGEATQWADNLMTNQQDIDPMPIRYESTLLFFAIGGRLGNWVRRNRELYIWDYEDLYGSLVTAEELANGDGFAGIPIVDDEWVAQNSIELDARQWQQVLEAQRAVAPA